MIILKLVMYCIAFAVVVFSWIFLGILAVLIANITEKIDGALKGEVYCDDKEADSAIIFLGPIAFVIVSAVFVPVYIPKLLLLVFLCAKNKIQNKKDKCGPRCPICGSTETTKTGLDSYLREDLEFPAKIYSLYCEKCGHTENVVA